MDINLIWQIAGIGIVSMIISEILKNGGQNDKAALVNLGGVIVIFLIIVFKLKELFEVVKDVFNFY